MRTRLLSNCPCSEYSNGPEKDWKEDLDATYDSEKVGSAMMCFSAMMYAGWEVVICGKHCAMMKKTIGMISCEFAGDSRKNLTKLWAIRYDFENYRQKNLSFFKDI